MSFPDGKTMERNPLIVATLGDSEMLATMYTETAVDGIQGRKLPATRAPSCGGGA